MDEDITNADLQEILFPLTLAECTVYLHEAYHLPEPPEMIQAEIKAGMACFYREKVEAKPGAKAFLEELKARGVKLTLATNTARSAITEGLARTGILPLLEGIYTTDEVGTDKHDPAFVAWCRHFASLGYVAASVNYRLGFHPAKKEGREAEPR